MTFPRPGRPAAAFALILALVPAIAPAQSGQFYAPPKVLSQGKTTATIAGAGQVTVQVFIRKDGSFEVTKVLASTNAGDDAAALEIAKTSTYEVAKRDGVAVDAFYDYALTFAAGLATFTGPASALREAIAALRDGNYDDAKTKLTAYLQGRPDDIEAWTQLGLADAFGKDATGAAVAFDKAGPIDPRYRPVAAQAYLDAAGAALKAEKPAEAAGFATKAMGLFPPGEAGPVYVRGVAESRLQKWPAAVADLEQARSLGTAAKMEKSDVVRIDLSLLAAYAASGAPEKTGPLVKEIVDLDPGQAASAGQMGYAAYVNAASAALNRGSRAEALALLEAGAAALPERAAALYSQAAGLLAGDKPVDWKKVKAETVKALAVDPADGRANLLAGVAVANDGHPKDAVPFLNKAKTSTSYTSDAAFAKQVDDALKAVGAGNK